MIDEETTSEDGAKSDVNSGSSPSDSDLELKQAEDDDTEGETWVEWIQKATSFAESATRKAQIIDWIEEQRRRKWRLADHLSRKTDYRWSTEVLEWTPSLLEGARRVGHPRRRW